jgi:MarR-like DNA-binding transcriptional regulator SgrR of sgrS sRNA
MLNQDSSTIHMPHDPRDPVVLVRDWPDPPLHLVPRAYDPQRVSEAAMDASVHSARQAQKAEREQAIEANLTAAAEDLLTTQLIDSRHAQRVAEALLPDIAHQDRLQAAAVAVRLSDPLWQTVTRYRAAQAALRALRNLLSANGVDGTITETELRRCADHLASTTQIARLRAWDGTEAVSAREWSRARLGLLSVTEER